MKKLQKILICIVCASFMLSQSLSTFTVKKVYAATESNIAVNGKAYAESTLITAGDKTFLNDSNLSTIWASETTSGYAGVEFNENYSVDKIRIVFKNYKEEVNKVLGFTVSYYDVIKGKTVQLYSDTSYSETNNDTEIGHKYYSEFTLDQAIITNDIKVTITSNTTGEEARIAEIQAFGEKYDESKIPVNLALGKRISATHTDYDRGPGFIVDGNKNNYWDGGEVSLENPQSFTIDLGEESIITEMRATPYVIAGRYYSYYIEVSKDGTTWNKVADRVETYGEKDAYVDETYTFDSIEARYVKVTVTDNNQNHIAHMKEFEVYGFLKYNSENVALGKVVTASNSDNGTTPDYITDGSTTGSFWDGGAASKEEPQSFLIDLGSGYLINKMKAYPYVDGIRYYEYNIETSLDGVNWTKVADRTAEEGLAYAGETFVFNDVVNARFVRVNMTYNSKVIVEPTNKAVHMREFEVYGEKDPNYEPITNDPADANNIAFGKTVRSHLNTGSVNNIVDGIDATYCTGEFAPAYFDIDLEENYELSEILLKMPVKKGRYYYFTIYGSNNGSDYDRLYQERSMNSVTQDGYRVDFSGLGYKYRIVRIYLEYVSDTSNSLLSEVRIHGNATGENKKTLRTGSIDEILDIDAYEATKYASEITEEETIENVYGIIDRNIGKEYRNWFTFELMENPKEEYKDYDYYTVGYDVISNKIVITGNDGVSLASGLNYYLKNYCKVNISEQANQTVMPDEIVVMNEAVYQYTPYEIRYAFNYCTLNYTFSYADAEKFQKEYDWMALNGVNCVLDLAGQEAVWIKFLMNFGYTFDEAKDWIAGPTYYAWQFMDNMEVIGGPVSDEWVKERLDMARENQRWKNSLGMQTVLQGYAGMVPNNFREYQDVEILEQGTWCNVPRPDMIRTDGELYDQYAQLFYEAQEWAFGATSDYYAVDPFHEGGIRPSDLTDDIIAEQVLESLLKADENAVWMVQAWWSNPTNELLKGMGDLREDHVMILDLSGLNSAYAPNWDKTEYGGTKIDSIEFNGTSWIWCMLENYGGNPSMDGQPKEIINRITYAHENSEHMKGIGFISEATYDNPVIYELVFDMAWQNEAIDLNEWLDEYVLRRYGSESENAREAWDLLLQTVYGRSGNTTQVIVSTDPKLNKYSVPYNTTKLEKALRLLYKDYSKLSTSEAYRYDLTEIMRQVVNNYAVVKLGELKTAYDEKDIDKFKEVKEDYLKAFDILNEVCGTQQDLLAGEWVGSAADWALDTNADDFAYDSMIINAKTLITVWAPSTYLGTYAYRNYEGMITDIYKVVWSTYLENQEDILETGSSDIIPVNYTKQCMEWIYENWDEQNYQRTADNSIENVKTVVEKVIGECSTNVVVPENEGNIALEKKASANAERPDSPGAPGGGYAYNVTDGILDTYWDGITWESEIAPYVIVDLEKDYIIDKMNVVNYYTGSRYYWYDLYVSKDGVEWSKVASREEMYGTTPSPQAGDNYIFEENKPVARYIKLVGLYNSSNEGFHVKEIRAYGTATANYEKVNELVQLANSLNAEDYLDFSDVTNAINNIVYDLDETKQAEVDAIAEALEIAITNLEKALYTVTVNGEEAATGAYNDKVTVTAPVVEGQTFTAWLWDGKVISTDETYTFFLSEDMELTPCYEAVEMNAEALLTNTMLVKRADSKADVKFVAQLVVPEGYTIKNAGLVWSSKEDIVLDLEHAKPTYITRISNTNQFSVTIKGMPTGKFIRGRIFATLVDSEGNATVVYSDEARVVNK